VFALSAVGGADGLTARRTSTSPCRNVFPQALQEFQPASIASSAARSWRFEVLALHLAVPLSIRVRERPVCARTSTRTSSYGELGSPRNHLRRPDRYATYVGGDAWEWDLYANRLHVHRHAGAHRAGGGGPVRASSTHSARRERERHDERLLRASACPWASVICGFTLFALNVYAKRFPETGIAATIPRSARSPSHGRARGCSRVRSALQGSPRRRADGRRAAPAASSSPAHGRRRTDRVPCSMAMVWLLRTSCRSRAGAGQNAAQYRTRRTTRGCGTSSGRGLRRPELRMAVAAAGAHGRIRACAPPRTSSARTTGTSRSSRRAAVFSRRHDKWDYEYSLGERNSDLIVETVDVTPGRRGVHGEPRFENAPPTACGYAQRAGSSTRPHRPRHGRRDTLLETLPESRSRSPSVSSRWTS